jgi:hypothetical protein
MSGAKMTRVKRTNSRSDLQRFVETLALTAFGKTHGYDLKPTKLELDGCSVEIDGYFKSDSKKLIVLAEAWAHVGEAKGAQPKKVLADVLKLAFVADAMAKDHPEVEIRKHFIFVDEAAADVLEGKKWGATAARRFGVASVVVQLEEQLMATIRETQQKQDVRNGS